MRNFRFVNLTCPQCNGTGQVAISSGVASSCKRCHGSGKVRTDTRATGRQSAAALRAAVGPSAKRKSVELAVEAELDAELGPFTKDTKGRCEMHNACLKRYGKTPRDLVETRLYS